MNSIIIIISCVIVATLQQQQQCPIGQLSSVDPQKCYFAIKNKIIYFDALNECKKKAENVGITGDGSSASLVSIHSAFENANVLGNIRNVCILVIEIYFI
jgi:hypothetical protein